MHFVTGGAFNGKRSWVWRKYNLTDSTAFTWHKGREGASGLRLPMESDCVIISEIEYYVKDLDNRKAFQNKLSEWLAWEEQKHSRKLILIGSDIGKGIVPIHQEDRRWRDLVGWCYQDIAAAAKEVDIIWYGIAQTVKRQ